jgi:hypothetical protein
MNERHISLAKPYRIIAIVVALLVGGEAKAAELVGLSVQQLIRCAGLPNRQMSVGGDNYFEYSTSRRIGTYGDGFATSRVVGCDATVTIRNGRVVSVDYKSYGAIFNIGLSCARLFPNCQ